MVSVLGLSVVYAKKAFTNNMEIEFSDHQKIMCICDELEKLPIFF